ncbi:hypothetical protein SNE40_007679 [Patella caerulea]|uniref:Poly [ADP-ribose] polymerase n=1 Tax=Patella caerulea TaxID=87958 RepID=A0AAN8K6H6_PATCE
MPRRKAPGKIKDEPEEEETPVLKRQKTDSTCTKEVQWEWEDNGSVWTPLAPDVNTKVNDAYLKGLKKIELDVVPGVAMIYMFNESLQKNKRTGYSRRIRVGIKDDSDKDYYVWQFQDKNKKWNPYSVEANMKLTEAYKDDNTSTITHKDAKYHFTVDLKKLTHICKSTGYTCNVERTKLLPMLKTEANDDEISATNGAGDAPATKSGRGKSTAKSASKSGKSGGKLKNDVEEGETKSVVRKIVKKGEAPVDADCPIGEKAHVLSEGKVIWDCMLNQTNLGNNNNKYYLIQLLEEDNKKSYHVWQRWGRVGYKGQNNLVPTLGDLDKAKNIFCKKFRDKTSNDWSDRDNFEKVGGKYDLLAMDYNPKEEDEVDAPSLKTEKSDTKYPDSKIDKPIQDLVNLICDIKSMEEAVIEMKYDAKKAPLGKLTAAQIKAGYSALKVIETLIDKNKMGQELVQACDAFYTRIPHNFGMRQPPTIRTKPQVKEKLQLLEALGDIEIAIKILKSGDKSENPIDRHYHSLKCDIGVLDKTHPDYKICEQYLQTTHATTHNQYKMELLDVFTCNKDGEFVDHGNRTLLWHGSRLTNWVGILSQGLRIAPPEAPVTGYMFGKGVYFADMSSKSANYCFTSKAKNIGLLLLCEVSLGNVNTLLNADYTADKLPKGKHSVLGAGRVAPDPKSKVVTSDGVTVPIGKGQDTKVVNPNGYTLNYNEYIVYDTKQIKMKYLLKVKFNYR